MKQLKSVFKNKSDRRSFIKNGVMAAGAATAGVGLLTRGASAFAQTSGQEPTPGDMSASVDFGGCRTAEFL
jgi:hypothetical protein